MHNVLLIIRREFLERVRTKAFVIGTVLFPVFMIAMMVLPALIKPGGGDRTLVLVDQSPAGIGARVEQLLKAPSAEKNAIRYTIERTTNPLESQRAALNKRVESKEIDGYVVIGADVLQSSKVMYRARDVTKVQVVQDLDRAISGVVQQERLKGSGMTAEQVARLVQGVDIDAARVSGDGEETGGLMSTLITAYVIFFLFMQLITLYGQNAMRSVLEEKNNRIVEVIVSSVRPMHLMAGKILGLASVALLQISIWVSFAALVASQQGVLSRRFGMSAGAFSALNMGGGTWAALLIFFVLGFILYAAMYAAAGSTVTSEQEAQQLAFPMMLPLLIPVAFIMPILTDPMGNTARVLSMIPFTSPVVMPMRAVATDVPLWEIALSVVLLVMGMTAVVWLAGKIYRVGILSTGKKPTLAELGRWLRAA
ncbi:ABC transporter permease [Longimicrobium terrae]|uniref:ABC-2 type transport system permease protein n=1 Tax=Longimicrobium terrae TaxID=1639882 RepID=A0A841GVQ3_9BACT|nr:ABC transporter permease [Longimicrobium terrae]MBB4635089.1 ABC-2 type transport system permease protein [Longimicrobium terrae]MBB6069483.1 ABC-2 type transport system permease protein [Longimicrobium terrae]NNC31714.1 ABC transporter permease [Longimicrobium terrae]